MKTFFEIPSLAYLVFLFLIAGQPLLGQNSSKIEGKVLDALSNEPLPFVNIILKGTNIGTTSDLDGNFRFTGLAPGFVTLQSTFVGYEMGLSPEIQLTNANTSYVEIKMTSRDTEIQEVVIKASPFRRTEESPVSLTRIGVSEIETNPGSNRDISKVIRSFPGVGSGASFRSDIIVRGGGPSESRFYLDGMEIPNINHFATQGSSGGPAGILNADLLSGVNFYSGAFPANRGNALSGVFEFTQTDGNPDKFRLRGTLGASELSLTVDGPIGNNSTLIFSARRSYLKFLFSLIELPFLPTFTDYQMKYKIKLSPKDELSIISIGALDEFALNLNIKDPSAMQEYILTNIPVNEQWSYAIGAVYKHFRQNSFQTIVLSRNMLNNASYKYPDNDESKPKSLDYNSQEIENKFRFENNTRLGEFKLIYGLSGEYAKYNNQTQQQIFVGGMLREISYDSDIDLFKWGAFGQVSKSFFNSRLTGSFGLRMDANDYSKSMSNMLEQTSPRFSLSYALSDQWTINANTGRYFQLPAYTTLGYENRDGVLINRENDLKYIRSDHFIAGIQYQPKDYLLTSLEGFYKTYNNYPFSVRDSLSLATKGADFGVIGDEEVRSTGAGRSFGFEILNRTKLEESLKLNIIFSYTFVISQFEDLEGDYISTNWDNKHILNVTVFKGFARNWSAGLKWRFLGGTPYTPYDLDNSSYKTAWDATGRALLDYSQLNSLRLAPFHQLDLRVDKRFYFENWSLMAYIDIQNAYNFKGEQPDYIIRDKDENGNYILLDGGLRYQLSRVSSLAGTVLPSIGIMIQF
ncbi:MAG: TonB-dependent receptor [Bacteroidales bacterium]|nr:TonB-dependent receptor [Bacteroidales bacterium]MDD3385913.1 TonB-dependent receptor [Bacteroidales bacterium]MDD3871546.1 TonB-dependent receptor [Bacteroidales bacterium]